MIHVGMLLLLLLVPALGWAQAPPLEVRTNDGLESCIPSYAIAVNDGSLSCGTVAGKPAAIINMGTPTATTPWNQVTAGSNINALTVGNAGSLRPTGTGAIAANEFTPAGTNGNCAEWGAGGTLVDAGGPCSGMGAQSLNDLNDVTLTSPITGQSLIQSGTDWINAPVDLGNTNAITGTLQDVNITDALTLGSASNVDAASLKQGTVPAARVGADHLDTITEIAAGIRLGTGIALPTANALGVDGNCAEWDVTGLVDAGAPCGTGGGADENVKISAADTTTGFLEDKLLAGTNVTITKQNPGANETLTINSTGGGGTGTPQGPINSIQSNLDGVNFAGSTRCSIDPTTQAVTCTCDRDSLDDCANEMTSVPIAQSAPTTANRVNTYPKQTGTVYELCWNGNGDTGERCVDGSTGGTPPNPTVAFTYFDMAGLTNDGTGANSNFDLDTGTTTPAPETGNAIRFASLAFAAAGLTCVQRSWSFNDFSDLAANQNTVFRWISDATSGAPTLTMQAACWEHGEAASAVTFIGTAVPATPTTQGAETLNSTVLNGVDITGCTSTSMIYFRLCQTASTLTGGSNNTVRGIQVGIAGFREFPP